MAELTVAYETLKAARTAEPLYFVALAEGYSIVAFIRGTLIRCTAAAPAEVADFEATLKPGATAVPGDSDGELLAAPLDVRTADGKPITLMNLFPGDVSINYPGAGDDVATGQRFAGAPFRLAAADYGAHAVEWQFREWVYLAGGNLTYQGAQPGDELTFLVYAPASPATEAPGAGAYAKQPVGGGLSRFVPQAGGGWDLDLAARASAAVGFSAVVPVPNPIGAGAFDWSPDTEQVTANAGAKGGFDLYDGPIPLGQFVSRAQLLGTAHLPLTVPGVKPKRILAHWRYKIAIWNSEAKSLDVVWSLFVGRKVTT